ncbi:glutathione S-transferase family protein [Tsuneonella sp. HG249]
MKPVITAFKDSPDGGHGHARDMRVRWALEEVGQPYDERLVTFAEMKQPAHLAIHPFGKIPTYQEGDLALFESGAIVLHLAERHPGLLPDELDGRSRAIVWLFAALNTVEPPIVEREQARVMESEKPWFHARSPLLDDAVRQRLGELSAFLGSGEWLDGAFSAGDLMMVMVLRRLEDGPNLLEEFPNLLDYVARGEARPAYQRAFAAQREVAVRAAAS